MMEAAEPPYASMRAVTHVVCVLSLAYFLSYLDRQIVTLLLPSLKADLGVSDTQVSLLQGMAFATIYAFAGLPMGFVADRTNRRNLIVAAICFWCLATTACGFAHDFWQFFAARMAVGLGEACLGPACLSILADYVRPEQRGRATAFMMAGAPIGAASSLVIGGLLLTSLTHGGAAGLVPQGWAPWQLVFFALGAPGLLVALFAGTLKEPTRRGLGASSRTDLPPARLVDFLRDRTAVIALFFGVVACSAVLTFAQAVWGPTVLMRIYGMAPARAGWFFGLILLLSGVVAGIGSGFVSDAIVKRWRLAGRVLIPLIIFPVAIVAQAALTVARDPVVTLGCFAVTQTALALIGTSFYPALQDLFPNELRGRAVALLGLVGSVGMGCGPTLVALVNDRVFHNEMMLQRSLGLVTLATAGLGFLLSLVLPGRYAQTRRHALQAPQPIASAAPLVAAAGAWNVEGR